MHNRMKPYLDGNESLDGLPEEMKKSLNAMKALAELSGRNFKAKKTDNGIEIESEKHSASAPATLDGLDIKVSIEAVYHNPASHGITKEVVEALVKEKLIPLLKEFSPEALGRLNVTLSARKNHDQSHPTSEEEVG